MNKDSYHSMKRGLALSLAVHIILFGFGIIHLTTPVHLSQQQLEAIPITLASLDQELSSQQGAFDAPVHEIPSVKSTSKPQEIEKAQHVGDGQVDSAIRFKPKEKLWHVETTQPISGEKSILEKSSSLLKAEKLLETKAEEITKTLQEDAAKVMSAVPAAAPQEDTAKAISEVPAAAPQEDTAKVIPEMLEAFSQEDVAKAISEVPASAPQEDTAKVIPEMLEAFSQEDVAKAISEVPAAAPQEDAAKVMSAVPASAPQEDTAKVMSAVPAAAPQEDVAKAISEVPAAAPQEDVAKAISEVPAAAPQEDAAKAMPAVPAAAPQEDTAKAMPAAPAAAPQEDTAKAMPAAPAASSSTIQKMSTEQPSASQQATIVLPDKSPLPQFKPKSAKQSTMQNMQTMKKQNPQMTEMTIEHILAREEKNLLNRARTQGGGAKRSSKPEALGARKDIGNTAKMAQTLVSIAGGCIQKKLKLVALGGDLKNRPVVRLQFRLNHQGMVIGDPVIDPLSGAESQQAIMIRQVYAAVFSCQPYEDLPRDQYNLWGQGFDFNVDPFQEITQ
ncbi:cell envelope biogenesis protein TolA [Bartonella sp. B35(2025)]